jgi:hypothetical protein
MYAKKQNVASPLRTWTSGNANTVVSNGVLVLQDLCRKVS